MLGAIAGDVIGSVYERFNIKTKTFPLFSRHSRFTDDSVLTVAVADSILHQTTYVDNLKKYYRAYPNSGYGARFQEWGRGDSLRPYNSWGNGSAMRVSPVGFAFESLDETLAQAEATALPTHNHPEGIKGAQATAAAIFLARKGKSKDEIKSCIETDFSYDLSFTLDEIRPTYEFDVSCQGSVPQAIVAFLESTDFEDAIRNAISIGGDSDTIACMAGGMAQAFYKQIPDEIVQETLSRLTPDLRTVLEEFSERFAL